jgi:hypothetical protein
VTRYDEALQAQLELEEAGTPKLRPQSAVWVMNHSHACLTQIQAIMIIRGCWHYLTYGSDIWYEEDFVFVSKPELKAYLKSITDVALPTVHDILPQ